MNDTTKSMGAPELKCPYCNVLATTPKQEIGEFLCSACGAAFKLASPLNQNAFYQSRSLGRFQVIECVGQGSYASVWRARDSTLDRIVALKIPHHNLLDGKNFRERFKREAQAVAKLRHSGIVPVYEVLEIDGLPVLVSDFIKGVSLKELLEVQRLTFRESSTLIAEIADALDHAHDQGLIHRDVKPANILIERTHKSPPDCVGKALIVDFGVALREELEVILTVDGQLVGTPRYMSPEQATGKGHLADRRSDVYSLGVILYELLCAEPPFRGTRTMLLHQVIYEQPQALRKLNDRIPRDLETICLKALAKEPSWRYRTAAELAADLRRSLRGEAVMARPLGPVHKMWLWSRRNRSFAAASLMAGLAIISLLALSVAFALRERDNASVLSDALQQSNANFRESQFRLAESHISQGISLCEQQSVGHGLLWLGRALSIAPSDAVELDRYLRTNISTWQSRQCELVGCLENPCEIRALAFRDDESCLFIGNDGNSLIWDTKYTNVHASQIKLMDSVLTAGWGASILISGHPDGYVRRWKLPNLEAIEPPINVAGRVQYMAANGDGSIFLTVNDRGSATLSEIQAGVVQNRYLDHGSSVNCIAVSKDGKWAVTGGEDCVVNVWDTSTLNKVHIFTHDDKPICFSFSEKGGILATGYRNGSVRLLDITVGRALDFRAQQPGLIRSVAISSDEKYILTGSRDRTARLWSIATNESVGCPLQHESEVKRVAFSKNGERILTSTDHSARVWAIPKPDVSLGSAKVQWIRSIAFSPDSNMLLLGGGDFRKLGAVQLWNCAAGKVISTPTVHKNIVLSVSYSPDNRLIATAAADKLVGILDAQTGQIRQVLPHGNSVYFANFTPDGNLLLTGCEDGFARLWNPLTGQLIGELSHQGNPVMMGAFISKGDTFFTVDHGGSIRLFRTADVQLRFPKINIEPILGGGLSPDGSLIAVAAGKKVHLIDTTSGKLLEPPLHHPATVRIVALSPDNSKLLVGGDDGSAHLWDLPTGKRWGTAFTHKLGISMGLFSPDGKLVLLGSADGTVQLYDTETCRKVGATLLHRGPVTGAAFSSDGKRFATGSSGGTGWLCDSPIPWRGAPVEINAHIEAITGLKLDSRDQLVVLNSQEWQKTAKKLEE